MKAYSSDLRERVLAAAEDPDRTQPEIAETFGVSLSCVEHWLATFRQTRRCEPLPHAGGKPRVLQPYAALLRQLVAQQPDATLEELCALVAAQTGVQATPSRMCRELQFLKLPRKKVFARQPAGHPTGATIAAGLSRPNAGHPVHTRRPSQIH